MNKQWSTLIIAVLLLVFAGYVILDVIRKKEPARDTSTIHEYSGVTDKWIVSKVFEPGKGQLNAVTVSENGRIFLGGEPFIACYDTGFNLLWEYKTGMPVTALTVSGNSLFASVQGTILVLSMDGEKTDEWGPFENNSMITSLSANEQYVAFADAANKTVFILDKKGVVKFLIGKSDEPFIIPSSYFDVALTSDNILYAANTGNRRIEKRSIDGKLLEYFGEPGTEPGAFCGCCNPAHFTLIPGGFITSEKGINRIKILNIKGEFVEFVSSVNKFVPPLPLDIASSDGKIIFGANPADSKIYVFKRK
jgi:outer membrane protein assembly factor BamB